MNRAVLYARSSKDRHDVSIEAQLRQLQALAAERNLVVVKTFSDSVERADDLDRPGLRGLLHELKSAGRAWDVVIMLDTARLARQDQGFAFVFDRECEKRGVRVIYKMLPETHPVMDLVFRQMVRAWDMLHSLMSREKGLAGMAENVRQGHRAGGRAPFGFRLVHTPTGATRDGAPVTKSRLEPNDDAPRIAAYLRDRAAGVPRLRAREGAALLELADTTLIGVEWNALTYAGFTVWNVHAERKGGAYVGGKKRRPRAQWVMQPDTHQALITKAEAEAILAQLEATTRTRARPAERIYLLAGILTTPAGEPWHGDRGSYRVGKGRKITAERVEVAVLEALGENLQSDEIVRSLLARIRKLAAASSGEDGKRLDAKARELTKNIDRVSQLLTETTAPQALLRSIEGWEAERTAVLDRKLALEEARRSAARMRNVGEADVRSLLKHLADELLAEDRPSLKDALARMLDGVTLDPESYACVVRWRLSPRKSGDKLASPRDLAAIPPFEARFTLPANRSYVRRAA